MANDVDVTIQVNHFVNISVGTPPEPMRVILDLQRPELMVFTKGLDHITSPCERPYPHCLWFGVYDPDESSTRLNVSLTTLWSYRSQIPADVVTFRGEQIENVPIYPMYWNSLFVGADSFMGLAAVNTSFPYRLVDQGLIRSPSFSLWGNISEEEPGGLLFGGVNTAKYEGPLQAFRFDEKVAVPVSGVQVQTGSEAPRNYTVSSKPFILTVASIHTVLPEDIAQQIYTRYNISQTNKGLGKLDCSRQETEDHTISLVIGDAIFSAPWRDLFEAPSSGSDLCTFMIQATYDRYQDTSIYGGQIGMTFSKHMYIALNYNSKMVGVAMMNPDPGPDHILEIGDGPAIPDAEGDFPTSIVPYSLATVTSTSTSTSTSTGSAAQQTMALGYAGGLFAGFAGSVVMAAL